MAVSCGTNDYEYEKLESILKAIPEISFICLDVANGYTQQFIDIVRKTRSAYPQHTIIVSNF
jgi:GMP reductase